MILTVAWAETSPSRTPGFLLGDSAMAIGVLDEVLESLTVILCPATVQNHRRQSSHLIPYCSCGAREGRKGFFWLHFGKDVFFSLAARWT